MVRRAIRFAAVVTAAIVIGWGVVVVGLIVQVTR